MRRLHRWTMLMALLTVAVCWLSCSSDTQVEQVYTLVVEASKAISNYETRGLQTDGGKIDAIWNEGDQVTVQTATGQTIGTMTPLQTGAASTKLKAELTSAVSIGDELRLLFPRTGRDYTGQVGTLADIASKYDYAEAAVTVTNIYEKRVTASDAKFANQQAIVKFCLTDKDGDAINASSLTVSAPGLITSATTTGSLTITPASATSEIYAALSGISDEKVTLEAADGKDTYTYTTSVPKTFENSMSYTVTVKMALQELSALSMPLTLECAASEASIAVINSQQLEYRKNGGAWYTYNGAQLELKKGDRVSFRGDEATYTEQSQTTRFVCNGSCYVYGNVMSLVYKDDFATKNRLPYDNTFTKLFQGNDELTYKKGYDLILPATKLLKGCYTEMFSGCERLNRIVCLATDIEAEDCTFQWMKNVAESGTFVKAASMNEWAKDSADGIPEGWKVEDFEL